jgi:[citrate (pro-3S)-lyase] ligase
VINQELTSLFKLTKLLNITKRLDGSISNERALNISLLKVVAEILAKKSVTFVVIAGNHLDQLEYHTETERQLKAIRFAHNGGIKERISWLRSIPEHFDALYGDLPQYSKEYIDNIFTPIPNINTRRGRENLEYKSKYVNITNGCRHTAEQPGVYDNSIFVVGNSSVYGFGCEDKHTLPSILQRLINNSKNLNTRYAVFNLGARGKPKFVDFYKLLNLNVLRNDIVVMHGIPQDIVEELSPLSTDKFHLISPGFSKREHREEIFFDAGHVTYKGHTIIAHQIFNSLFSPSANATKSQKQSNIINLISKKKRTQALKSLSEFTKDFRGLHSNLDKHPDLLFFIDELKALTKQGLTGALVVNCNPFTLGHRHLIEYSASKVDNLFVFVVEEDLSYFDFETRFSMVIEGTKDIDNCKIVRGGKYIMSTITYPEYFSKEEEKILDLNASTDMAIFGEYIAPALNISVRFIGEEPICDVTRQHNNQMRHILPTYGVRVEETKRILNDGQIISASLVRQYIQTNEIDRIRKLVPPSTFRYINCMKDT